MTYGPDTGLRQALAYHPKELRRLTRPFLAHFGNKLLRNITARRIYLYRHHRLRAGAAATTVNKEEQVLRRVLAGAGLNPQTRTLPPVPRKHKRVDFDRLASVASGNIHWLRALAVAALVEATGLSRRELRALTWECQDPFRQVIQVRGKKYPVAPYLRKALVALEEKRTLAPGRCRVSDRIVEGMSWKDAWRALRKAAGMEGITLRDCSR